MNWIRKWRARSGMLTLPAPSPVDASGEDREFVEARRTMIERQLRRRKIRDEGVLTAMGRVPRHWFVQPELREQAYEDHPLEIGHGQTISQPYVIARMLELAELQPGDRVLEVGLGCGYQAALLCAMGMTVCGLEIVPELASGAARRLERLGCGAVQVRCGNGYLGWPEGGRFDAIVLAAAPRQIPRPLLEQLTEGGRLIAPVGPAGNQQLVRVRRQGERFTKETIFPVRFVPMVQHPSEGEGGPDRA